MFLKNKKIASWIIGAILTGSVSAQVTPSGSETIVNTTTANSQTNPSVAMDSSSNFNIIWESYNSTNKAWEIKNQLYNSGGTANGSEVSLFSDADYNYRYPVVATSKSGVSAVVYSSKYKGTDDPTNSTWNSYLRFYDATGAVLTSNTRIRSTLTGEQIFPDVAITPDGSYTVVVCQSISSNSSADIYLRQKNSSYATTASEMVVNSTTGNIASNPKVAIHTDGSFVVVWQYESGNTTDGSDIYGQMYDAALSTVGAEFLINSTTDGNQTEPDVAYSNDGSFIVTWSSYGQDGDQNGIYRQKYDAVGNKSGSETRVNTTTANSQSHPHISSTLDGYFNISWTSYSQDGNFTGIYTQSLDSLGNVVTEETKLNSRTNDFQQFSSSAQSYHDGDAIFVWQDGLRNSTSTHDGDDYGIVFNRFSTADTTDPVAVCQSITAYLNDEGYALIDSADIDNSSSDNYGFYTVSLSNDSVTCADLSFASGTMTVTDLAGNSASCSYDVIVLDTISPTLTVQNITVYLNGTGNASVSSADLVSSYSDNCSVASVVASDTVYDCSQVGTFKVEVVVTDASGNTTSDSVTVTVGLDGSQAAIVWGGYTDTDWNTASNWSCGRVPLADDNVLIADVVNDPIIDQSSSSPAVCRNLEIESGGVLTINPTKAMTISGTVENNGTFTLKSDATGTATLITESTISGSGAFNVEQYLTGSGTTTPNGRRWYTGSPLVTSTSATINAAGNNRMWLHDEATGYEEITNNSTSLNSAQGYVLRLGATETLNFTGSAFNTGDISNNSLGRTGTTFYNRGYNLLSNPYPSFVSWNDISKTNLSETMWIRTYNGSVMVFDTYNSLTDIGTNNSGDGDLTEEIAPMQAFWTLVSSDGLTGGITFNNASRSHDSALKLRAGSVKQLIRVRLNDSGITDELVINFNDNALSSFEQYDSKKFFSGTLSELSCPIGNEDLVINSLPIANWLVVPVKVTLKKSGTFSFLAIGFEGMDDYDVHIEDKVLQTVTPFNDGTTYEFSANTGVVTNRFEIIFALKGTTVGIEKISKDVIVFGFNNTINISLSNINKASVRVYNATGQLLFTHPLTTLKTVLPTNFSAGIYFVEVINNGKSTAQKIKL